MCLDVTKPIVVIATTMLEFGSRTYIDTSWLTFEDIAKGLPLALDRSKATHGAEPP